MNEVEDPMRRLEQAVHRKDAEERGAKALSNARIKLVLGRDAKSVFFATLALKLKPGVDWNVETAYTDGTHLLINPDWFLGLTEEERIGVVAHEVMHPALNHHTRRGPREVKRWNIAADLSINPMIVESGLKLPADASFPGLGSHRKLPPGLSAEAYYNLLAEPGKPDEPDGEPSDEPGDQPGGDGGCGGLRGPGRDPGGCGGVTEPKDGSGATSPAKQRESEAEWEVALAQAHETARKRGDLPGGLDRLVEAHLAPKVDWKEVLREFVSRHAKNDYSWNPPNKKFLHLGIYLPGMRSEELGDVIVAVDTSGSIGGEEIARFGGEIEGILSSFDVKLTIIYCDCQIHHVQEWCTSDGPLVMEPKGGGGTSHIPVFDWIEEKGLDPACLVCLTDMYTSFPDNPPGYPVLWAATTGVDGPWGQTVQVEL